MGTASFTMVWIRTDHIAATIHRAITPPAVCLTGLSPSVTSNFKLFHSPPPDMPNLTLVSLHCYIKAHWCTCSKCIATGRANIAKEKRYFQILAKCHQLFFYSYKAFYSALYLHCMCIHACMHADMDMSFWCLYLSQLIDVMLILKDQSTSQLLLVGYLLGLLLLYSLLTLLVGSEITDKRYTRKLTLSFLCCFFL